MSQTLVAVGVSILVLLAASAASPRPPGDSKSAGGDSKSAVGAIASGALLIAAIALSLGLIFLGINGITRTHD